MLRVQLLLCLRLAAFEFGDARRLVEELASVLGLGAEDLIDLTLPYDGIALLADARIVEELRYILQAAYAVVDHILRLAGAVQPP